jgi:hypothetical protein
LAHWPGCWSRPDAPISPGRPRQGGDRSTGRKLKFLDPPSPVIAGTPPEGPRETKPDQAPDGRVGWHWCGCPGCRSGTRSWGRRDCMAAAATVRRRFGPGTTRRLAYIQSCALHTARRRRWHDVNRGNQTDSDPAHCNAKEHQHAGEPVPEQRGFRTLLPTMSDGSRTRPIPPPGFTIGTRRPVRFGRRLN